MVRRLIGEEWVEPGQDNQSKRLNPSARAAPLSCRYGCPTKAAEPLEIFWMSRLMTTHKSVPVCRLFRPNMWQSWQQVTIWRKDVCTLLNRVQRVQWIAEIGQIYP